MLEKKVVRQKIVGQEEEIYFAQVGLSKQGAYSIG